MLGMMVYKNSMRKLIIKDVGRHISVYMHMLTFDALLTCIFR